MAKAKEDKAPQEKAPEVFLLKDPTSRANTRIVRLYSAEECERFIKRGWVIA
jgi:hypothetical protein